MAGNGLSAETRAAIEKWAPKIDKMARRRYQISGRALLGKLVIGESGDNEGAVSKAGAKGRTQFMPGSRDIAIKKFGIDPWRSADEAVHGAVLHLQGKINGSKGLEGYNPGDPNYPSYILDRKVGDLGASSAPATVGSGFTTKTLEQTSINRSTDDEAAVIDSLLAGKSGRKGASLASDIATRIGSGNYTTETPTVEKTKVSVPTVGSTPGAQPNRRNGKVNIPDSALYQGHQLKDYTLDFLDRLSSRAGTLNISSGTRAPGGLTTSGKVSDHGDGSAADIAARGKRGDQIAEAAFLELGVDSKQAKQWAKAGGLYNINRDGKRYQIIWKTNQGGNHYDHVHVGIRPQQ